MNAISVAYFIVALWFCSWVWSLIAQVYLRGDPRGPAPLTRLWLPLLALIAVLHIYVAAVATVVGGH